MSPERGTRRAAPAPPPPEPPRGRLAVDLAIVLGALVLGTVVAELAGAVDLGTALTFGVMAFLAATMYVLLRR